MNARLFFKELGAFWKTIILIGTPLVFMPWPIVSPIREVKTAYVLIIMLVYWVTEVIPIAVTSLLPVILFPLLGVLKSSEVCPNYMRDTIMLFVGGLMVAVAIEKSNLHKRIAIRTLLIVGTKPRCLMLGFMISTWFLSMWISNTATAAMMIPIVEAVLAQLKISDEELEEANKTAPPGEGEVNVAYEKEDGDGVTTSNVTIQYAPGTDDDATANERHEKAHKKLCKAMCLCVCYSASVGGIATLTGTPPNLEFSGQAEIIFQKYGMESGVNFTTWFAFAIPISAMALILAWLWLQTWFMGCCKAEDCCCGGANSERSKAVSKVIRREYEALGPIRFEEIAVLIHFILLAVLWLTRNPKFIPGWADVFLPKYVSDATPAIFITILLFMFPAKRPNFFCCRGPKDDSSPGPREALLDWETVCHRLPWGVIILLGGGFSVADACAKSGLSAWLGQQLAVLGGLPTWAIVMLITLITAAATEVTSNTATATLLMPIMGELAITLKINPLYFMIPVCIAASLSFMLPVATPPNAIVFSYGHLRIVDMVLSGIPMNIIGILLVTLAVETWGKPLFSLDILPDGFLTDTTTVSFNITTVGTV